MAHVSQKRCIDLGFIPQKENLYNQYLPYSDAIDAESSAVLSDIKQQLARSVELRDIKVSSSHWIGQLMRYIRLYGFKFSKEDHVLLITLLYEILTIPDMEPSVIVKCSNAVISLLKKVDLLSRNDLVLPWQPLYSVIETIMLSSKDHRLKWYPSNIEVIVEKLVCACRLYFPATATREMLEEWRPLLCPSDTAMRLGIMYLSRFLPVNTTPAEQDISHKLWLTDFLFMWDSLMNCAHYELPLLTLFSKLAENNIGYIDWDPHIPMIFTHILRSFDLPVGSKINITVMRRGSKLPEATVSTWVASMLGGGSCTQDHIDKLFLALQSFYHPSNSGSWTTPLAKLLWKLPEAVVDRVHRERYAEPSWRTAIPESHKLTDDDITKFVLSMRSVAFMGMFSKHNSQEASLGIQLLSWLHPKLILPQLLEIAYPALETLTEPHRLLSCLSTLVGVARPMVSSELYLEGRLHVLPLLNLLLPGIDPNDHKKSLVTLQMISAFLLLVPAVDSSAVVHTRNDLTDMEKELCSATAQFEDFVLLFMDRVFSLIETNATDHSNHHHHTTNQSFEHLNSEMLIMGSGLVGTFTVMLYQCSPQLYQVALNRLFEFVRGTVYELKVGGRFIGQLCRTTVRVNAKVALKKFVPHLCSMIQESVDTHETIATDEQLDEEFLWHLLMLSQCAVCDGVELLHYNSAIKTVLTCTLSLRSNTGYTLAASLLRNTLTSYTTCYDLYYNKAPTSDLPIRNWAESADLNNLELRWHIPSADEIAAAQDLVDTFLTPIVQYLQDVTGSQTIDREELEKQLSILASILLGIGAVAPALPGQPIVLRESQIPFIRATCVCSCGNHEITLSGRNIRLVIAETLSPLLKHMLEHCEDDIKSFAKLIKVYSTLILYFGVLKEEFDSTWKSTHYIKSQLEHKIQRKKRRLRLNILSRIQLQHELRVLNNPRVYTASHDPLFHDLLTLSTSRYPDVRKKAQSVLFAAFNSFPYSYRRLLHDILANISPDPGIPEYKYKGSLYLIKGQAKRCLGTKLSWEVVHQVWPALIRAKHSEKPSIQKLRDDIIDKISDNIETIAIITTVTEGCLDAAHRLLSSPCPASSLRSEVGDAERGEVYEKTVTDTNMRLYKELETTIIDLINSGELMWKFEEDAMELLAFLLRHDLPPSSAIVSVFVNRLNNESSCIRILAVSAMATILFMLKRKRAKQTLTMQDIIEGGTTDTTESGRRAWHRYRRDDLPTTKEKWDRTIFVDKTHWGYNIWPKKLSVLVPTSEQICGISHDAMNDSERVIYEFFVDPKNVEKFLEYLSMEGSKSKDKLDRCNMLLIHGLFRNYGDIFLESFKPTLERLVSDTNPVRIRFNHRCVMEVLAGIIRGSKTWPFEKLTSMWVWIIGLLKKTISGITAETIEDWKRFYRALSENRDPRRLFWLFEFLIETPLSGEGGSFGDYSRLMVMQESIKNQEWRVVDIHERVITYLLPHIGHAYNIVRNGIASVLTWVYMFDYMVRGTKVDSDSASRKDLLDAVLPKLQVLKYESSTHTQSTLRQGDLSRHVEAPATNHELMETLDAELTNSDSNGDEDNGLDTSDHKQAVRICKTMVQYVTLTAMQAYTPCTPEMLSLLPIFCAVFKNAAETDDSLKKKAAEGLACLAQCCLDHTTLSVALSTLAEISEMDMWHARLVVPVYLQIAVFRNLFIVNDPVCVDSIRSLLLRLLCDEQLEVRQCAAEAISGLVQCGYLKHDNALMQHFVCLSRTSLTRSSAAMTTRELTTPTYQTNLIRRHAGVLGLCALVQAYPYDVPQGVPDVLMVLSNHVNDPQLIEMTVKKTLSDFRRTHHDNWHDHKQKFTDDQLGILTDLLVSPTYYV